MSPYFAMAGLAEAVFAQALLIAWGGICVVGLLVIVTWFRRSWPIGLAAIIIGLLVGIYLGPVEVLFGPERNPQALSDPDYLYWTRCYRIMSSAWLVVTVLTLVSIPLLRKFPKPPLSSNSQPKGLDPSPTTI